jgi:nucleoredoxin
MTWRILMLCTVAVFLSCTEREGGAPAGTPAPAAPEKGAKLSLKDILGNTLTTADGKSVSIDQLSGKKVGLYFSASWCPPCHVFTPRLVEFYNVLKKQGKLFEIVLVNYDETDKDMAAYMRDAKMPWLAMPFDENRAKKLWGDFKIPGIPTLIVVGADEKIITRDGRADVEISGAEAFGLWGP